jgi:hypothetical protein
MQVGLDILEPEDEELRNRITLVSVAERGFNKPFRLRSADVDEDERVFEVEEALVRWDNIACLYSVVVKRLVRHLDQSVVHPVLGLQRVELGKLVAYKPGEQRLATLEVVLKSRSQLFLISDHHELLGMLGGEQQVTFLDHRCLVDKHPRELETENCALVGRSSTRCHKNAVFLVNFSLDLLNLLTPWFSTGV